jgi:hypothetical protein
MPDRPLTVSNGFYGSEPETVETVHGSVCDFDHRAEAAVLMTSLRVTTEAQLDRLDNGVVKDAI